MNLHIVVLNEEGQRHLSYDISYIQNLKINSINELIHKTEIESQTQKTKTKKLMVTRGEGGRDKLGDWGWHADTTIYKIKS